MEFPYYKVLDFPKHQKRARLLPWIKVGIYNPDNPENVIYVLGLADTGAEPTMIDREIAEELDFDVVKGKIQDIIGVGGGVVRGYMHKVGFIIDSEDGEEKIQYEDFAILTKNPFPKTHPQQTAILGTMGFFKHLIVTFYYPKQITISSNKS